MKSTVYCLYDTKTGDPIYVGSCSCSPKKRLCIHRTSLKNSTAPIYEYIRKNKIDFSMRELEQFDFEHRGKQLIRESWWYHKFVSDGHVLYNKRPPKGYKSGGRVEETEIVKLLAAGESSETIAEKLGIHKSKLSFCVTVIRSKYEASNNAHLVAIFFKNKFIR